MLRGFFGNLISAIIAQMLCGNHLNCLSFLQFRGKENFDSLLHEDLLTIDMETVATLREEEEGSTVPPAQATQESTLMPATPISATNRNTVSTTETPVSEEVIKTCVTPRKVRAVQSALKKENERHRCAVKLLPYFFTDEELISSNTNGTHGKLPLDSNKLNFLLVFSKFPVEFAVEKEKVWKFIKTKINDQIDVVLLSSLKGNTKVCRFCLVSTGRL